MSTKSKWSDNGSRRGALGGRGSLIWIKEKNKGRKADRASKTNALPSPPPLPPPLSVRSGTAPEIYHLRIG